jgi:hypothetical protein
MTRAQGRDVEMSLAQTIDLACTVQGSADGAVKLAQRFERWRLTRTVPAGKQELDTKDVVMPESGAGKALQAVLKGLVDAEFTTTVDARGVVGDVVVPRAFVAILKDNPLEGMDELFTEEGLKRLLRESTVVLPAALVSKGDAWSHTTELKMPFGLQKTTTLYAYDGPVVRAGKKLEQISFKPMLTIEPDPAQKLDIKLKMVESKGTAWFDNQAGRLVESESSQLLTIDVVLGEQTVQQRIAASVKIQWRK